MSSPNATHQNCHSKILNDGNPLAETNTRRAMILTAIMMVVVTFVMAVSRSTRNPISSLVSPLVIHV